MNPDTTLDRIGLAVTGQADLLELLAAPYALRAAAHLQDCLRALPHTNRPTLLALPDDAADIDTLIHPAVSQALTDAANLVEAHAKDEHRAADAYADLQAAAIVYQTAADLLCVERLDSGTSDLDRVHALICVGDRLTERGGVPCRVADLADFPAACA